MTSPQPKTSLARCLRPWALPLAVLAVASFGLVLPFVFAQVATPPASEQAVRLPPLDPILAARGRDIYASSCVACHAADAHGVANLGKDLTTGFALSSGDSQLVSMIVKGRQPGEPGHTSAVPMPPKGGRADLTSADIASVVVYLRSLQDPSRLDTPLPMPVAEVEVPAAAAAVAAPSAPVALSESSASAEASQPLAFDSEAAMRGKKVFNSCIACHGKTGTGMPNLGADLVHSEFVSKKSDQELVAFIKRGRLSTDPETRMKLNMPPKGGNPALNDKQLADVVAYLRSLQVAQSASR